MNSTSDDIFKGTDNRYRYRVGARVKSKRRISKGISNEDLSDQLDCLQRAFSEERGEWTRFRNDILISIRLVLDRRAY